MFTLYEEFIELDQDNMSNTNREFSPLKELSVYVIHRDRQQIGNLRSRPPSHVFGPGDIIASRCLMIDHEKFQKGRAWVLGVAAVAVAIAAIWKLAVH